MLGLSNSMLTLSLFSEIFGPVLILVPVQDVDEAIAFIQARFVHHYGPFPWLT